VETKKYLYGIGVSDGIAIGPAYVVRRAKVDVFERTIPRSEIDSERERFRRVIRKTTDELEAIRERMAKTTGESTARIIDAQIYLLNDPKLIDPIIEGIETELKNAEILFERQIDKIIAEFSEQHSGNTFALERVQDLYDLKNLVLSNLVGVRNYVVGNPDEASILVIPHLAPSESVQLLNKNIIGIVTERGGETSHIAIIARTMEIPAVVGVPEATEKISDKTLLILDAQKGIVIPNPDSETVKKYREKEGIYISRKAKFLQTRTQIPITLDGHRVTVLANIELPEQVELVKRYGGEGVGLFRTELLFISQEEFPSEERQFELYKSVISLLAPQPVIIRTFDIGGDKLTYSMGQKLDPNPFLGLRAIRIGIVQPHILKTQLNAILKSSAFGNVKIMFPMISNLEELQKAISIYEECKRTLAGKRVKFNENIELGIMVEVPSAAISSRYLAEYVNFFSIGTNDLIQYTLAVDRGNQKVAHWYQSFHPAVLKLIKETVSSARLANIWVGVCGEMAGDPRATILLLGLGIDEFSCVPMRIPIIKSIIRSVRYKDAQQVAEEALKCKSHTEVVELLNTKNKELLPSFILNNAIVPMQIPKLTPAI